jgi:hypothetical protein
VQVRLVVSIMDGSGGDLLSKFEQYLVHASKCKLINRHNSIIVVMVQGTTPLSLGPWGGCVIYPQIVMHGIMCGT